MFIRLLLAIAIMMPRILQVKPEIKATEEETLRLQMIESRKNELFPNSRDYIAVLTNDGTRPISIEAIQMSGGYAGSGRFYSCSVQFWKRSVRKWITPRLTKLSDFGHNPHVINVEVKPGDKLEVCNNLLPQQQGRAGDVVRFALNLQWGRKPALFSNKFIIAGESRRKDK